MPVDDGAAQLVGMRRRVTISDVAARLNLAKGTVSRALNGYPDIAESTRLRVRKAADAMGYRPLSHAQAIRTGRVRSIGLVLQIDEHDAHAPFLTDFLAGVSQAASREHWTLSVATATSVDDMRTTIARMIEDRKADGFILPRTRIEDPRIEFLRGADVPFILFGRTGDPTGCAWFDIRGEDAMRDAVLRLAELGHERVAFVGGGLEYNYTTLRHRGYLDGLADAGLQRDRALERFEARMAGDGAAATDALLKLPAPPTGIVYATDEAALGAYAAAERLGLSVGRELSIIAYDGIPEGVFANPPLTTFVVDTRQAGNLLAEMLIHRIRGADPESLREETAAQFVARGTDNAPLLSSSALADHVAKSMSQGGMT